MLHVPVCVSWVLFTCLESTSEITKSRESKSISHIVEKNHTLCFYRTISLLFSRTIFSICLGQVKSIAHLDFAGWLLYHSNKLRKERMKEKKQKKTHSLDLLVLHFEDYNVGFDKASISSFSLLSRQQPNSQRVLSAPYCTTSQGDWQTNRWGCHMFVKEPAKCSLQLANSSDIFPSQQSSLPLPTVAARSIWERHMTC